jgi:hypothetical protein
MAGRRRKYPALVALLVEPLLQPAADERDTLIVPSGPFGPYGNPTIASVSSVYVVYNARDDFRPPKDRWLVIDTVSGTAISLRPTRQEAEKDKEIVEAFYLAQR